MLIHSRIVTLLTNIIPYVNAYMLVET